MSQISHILAVVDPSATGRQSAVDKATFLAGSLNAAVELLVCDIESAIDDRMFPRHAHAAPPCNTKLLDILEELATPARAAGIDVKTRLIYGNSLHDSLLDYIRGSNADLVVKDTHHHTIAKRTFLRNTDWYLARGCAVPLLLTKNQTWMQPPVIMAAIDPTHMNVRASALDRQILHYAASLAGRLRSDLHVIHTFIPTVFANAVVAGKISMSAEYCQALQVESTYRFFEIEHLVRPYGVTRERLHVEMGTAQSGLMNMVRQHRTDVMVMGASSHGRWHRSVVGSTAATTLESLPCDILVVRPSHDAQAIPC
jgi:universal stress protein E